MTCTEPSMIASGPRNFMRILGGGTNELTSRRPLKSLKRRERTFSKSHDHAPLLAATQIMAQGLMHIRQTSVGIPPAGVVDLPSYKGEAPVVLLDDRSPIYRALCNEKQSHVDATALLSVNAGLEEKVDAAMRDDALSKLRSLHTAFYGLSTVTFCQTVSIVDLFCTRIKVKPKYILCVAAAAYFIASKFETENPDTFHPTRDNLVRLIRCGGNEQDLLRMVNIILTKLGSSTVTAIGASKGTHKHFLDAFIQTIADKPTVLPMGLQRKLEMALCSTEVAGFRPSCVAIAILTLYGLPTQQQSSAAGGDSQSAASTSLPQQQPYSQVLSKLRISDLYNFAAICRVEWDDVESCSACVLRAVSATESRNSYSPVKISSTQHFFSPNMNSPPLEWNLSRRTKRRMVRTRAPPLDTLFECVDELEMDMNDEGDEKQLEGKPFQLPLDLDCTPNHCSADLKQPSCDNLEFSSISVTVGVPGC